MGKLGKGNMCWSSRLGSCEGDGSIVVGELNHRNRVVREEFVQIWSHWTPKTTFALCIGKT